MILCSLILTVGSALTMNPQQGQQQQSQVPKGVNYSGNLHNMTSKQLAQLAQQMEQREKAEALKKAEQDEEEETGVSGLRLGFTVARAVTVALTSAWRIQHYMTQICKVTGNNELLENGLKFNGYCLAAAGAIALLDYCMPNKMGYFLGGIACMDGLTSWLGSQNIAQVVQKAAKATVKPAVETAAGAVKPALEKLATVATKAS